MANIKINICVDVEVKEKNGHSWEALKEGFGIIKSTLELNDKIGKVRYEGIREVYDQT